MEQSHEGGHGMVSEERRQMALQIYSSEEKNKNYEKIITFSLIHDDNVV